MTETLSVELQTSRTYLLLSITVYGLCLFTIWHYVPQLWLTIALSGLLSLWLYYYLLKNVLSNRTANVRQIRFTKNHINLTKNDQSTEQHAWCAPVYQSPFLIIFALGKQQLVIFKDATKNHSLSSINHLFNAQR